MSHTLNVSTVDKMNAAIAEAIKHAYSIFTVTADRRTFEDRADKFVHIRAERIIHYGLEQLDGVPYDNVNKAMEKSKAWREIKRAIAANNPSPKA